MIDLYTWTTPNGRKISIALEEMGLPYEIVGMDHPSHDLDSPSFLALNPFGQIPAVDDDGVVVLDHGGSFPGPQPSETNARRLRFARPGRGFDAAI